MIILDTNVLSALMRNAPDHERCVVAGSPASEFDLDNSITILEIQHRIANHAAGKKRVSLSEDFERLLDRIDHRIAAFDERAARLAAELIGFATEERARRRPARHHDRRHCLGPAWRQLGHS